MNPRQKIQLHLSDFESPDREGHFMFSGVERRELEPKGDFLQISQYLVRIQLGFVHRSRVFNHFHKLLPETLAIKSLGKENQRITKVILLKCNSLGLRSGVSLEQA